MDSQPLSVKVCLDCYKFETSHEIIIPHRVLTLQAPDWTVKIGRSTSSGTGPRQADDNGWYNSRVVSREHAELTADPLTGEVLIRDVGSMHGTHIHGRRLKKGVFERLHDGDTVVFGAEVGRADDIFYPVEVMATYTWSSEPIGAHIGASSTKLSNSTCNYFDLDHSDEVDYDEEVDYSDEEIEDHESEGNPESVARARGNVINNFSVPESDISDDVASIVSDDGPMSDQESPTSSPIGSVQREDNKENEVPPQGVGHVLHSPCPIDQSSLALGDHATDDTNSDGDSYYEDSSILDGDEDTQANVGDVLEFSPEPSAPPPRPVEDLSDGSPFQAPGLLLPSFGRPARDPSPSDAAMVKPADRPVSPPAAGRTLPPFQPSLAIPSFSPYQYVSSELQSLAQQPYPVPKSTSAWAGHNSVLYEPLQDSVVQDTYYNYSSGDLGSDFEISCGPRHAEIPTDWPRNSDRDFNDIRSVPHMNQTLAMIPMPVVSASNSAGQKRKADAISNDQSLVRDLVEEPARLPADTIMSGSSNSPDLRPIVETIETINFPNTAPTMKKAKKSKRDTGSRMSTTKSTVTKYVATALAGAVLGAAGTIWGLVALPKDFFV